LFVRRDDEIALLRRLIGDRRLICVAGGGGCGKTRLAVTVARMAAEAFDAVPCNESDLALSPRRVDAPVLPQRDRQTAQAVCPVRR
jgi:Flp pilus assembly CpaF family ATPase